MPDEGYFWKEAVQKVGVRIDNDDSIFRGADGIYVDGSIGGINSHFGIDLAALTRKVQDSVEEIGIPIVDLDSVDLELLGQGKIFGLRFSIEGSKTGMELSYNVDVSTIHLASPPVTNPAPTAERRVFLVTGWHDTRYAHYSETRPGKEEIVASIENDIKLMIAEIANAYQSANR